LAENCRVLEESGNMLELKAAKEETLLLKKQIQALEEDKRVRVCLCMHGFKINPCT
jgi:hypothetical protein